MRKDWTSWSVYLNANHFNNWGIGFNYYHEYAYITASTTNQIIARVFQIDLLFFNITITRWSRGEVFPSV